jgi:hypothetical protein
MGIQFFTNWELWEQLTFVLAAGIVAVFFIGWIKLWWMQRLLKKHALLDEEKRVRQSELRKSGLPVGRKMDIPFGVRAIQSGVEVEGIWISRPVTPMEMRSSSKASSTILDIDGEPKPEDKGKGVLGSVVRPTTTIAEIEPTPKPSPRISSASSYLSQSIRQETVGSTPPGPQTTYLQSYPLQRPTNDAARAGRYSHTTSQGEGIAARHRVETYVPASSSTITSTPSPRVRPVADRASVSSEEGLSFSSPRYPADVRSGPYRSAFEDFQFPPSVAPSRPQGQYCSRVRAETRGDTFESQETDRAPNPGPPSAPLSFLPATRPTPIRTYTDQRETTSARVVNSGFEVLPAGTFGRSGGDNEPTK